MFKELRKKFIIVSVSSVAVVLLLLISVVNIAMYCNICSKADTVLKVLEEGGGKFPDTAEGGGSPQKSAGAEVGLGIISPETRFEIRYFTVTFISEDTALINIDMIAAIDAETAFEYAAKLMAGNSRKGFVGPYRYLKSTVGGNPMFIFIDCSRELKTFYTFLFLSISVSVLVLLMVLVLVVITSKSAIRPIAESYEKQKTFITDASHELKTPLAIIGANTDVIEIENGKSEWTDSIKNQVSRLKEFTEKLVMLSRMDEENVKLDKRDFSLSEAVRESAEGFKAAAIASGKSFSLDIEDGINYCGDESMIRRLVGLLVDNAVKYGSDNGVIHVELTGGGKAKLTVYNTADNVDTEQMPMLFERFYRTDKSRNSSTGGHGIGLALAKSIVLAHNGKIEAESDGKSMTIIAEL